jgi:hypothetical protein
MTYGRVIGCESSSADISKLSTALTGNRRWRTSAELGDSLVPIQEAIEVALRSEILRKDAERNDALLALAAEAWRTAELLIDWVNTIVSNHKMTMG